MILWQIVAATFLSGVVSVLVAMFIGYRISNHNISRVVFFAVGVLLAVALLELLPRGFSELGAETGGATLLLSFVMLVLMSRMLPHIRPSTLAKSSDVKPDVSPIRSIVPPLMLGDSVHNFVDGVLIAAAFLQDPALGWMMAVAVVLHEVPQELGDFAILLWSGLKPRTAVLLNVLSSLAAIAGGVCGYLLLKDMHALLPYAMVVSAASFIYLAAVEVLPRMSVSEKFRETALQCSLLVVGIGFVLAEGWLVA